jgi:hypothetical protein
MVDMLTTHRSRGGVPFVLDRTRTYPQKFGPKPNGLWLSVDGDWQRWLEDEGYTEDPAWGLDSVEVHLDAERCLWLSTVAELDDFHDHYARPFGHYDSIYHVEWPVVAQGYAGIIIAPYLWGRRLEGAASSWYYGWDCASACVWDLSAVSVNSDVYEGGR